MASKVRTLRTTLALRIGLLALVMGSGGTRAWADEDDLRAAAAKAVAYLEVQVPAWKQKNGCFSCHNNGDGARALLVARRRGFAVADASLATTLDWLRRPAGWNRNQGDARFSDKRLAAIQFSAALQTAWQARVLRGDRELASLREAADQVATFQQPSGRWQVDAANNVGSPITYGDHLATLLALRVLRESKQPALAQAIEKGRGWLLSQRPLRTVDAAAVLWEAGQEQAEVAQQARRHALATLQSAQQEDGGWGPFRISRSEPFDTAVSVLALQSARSASKEVPLMIVRGRAFLLATQRPDGSWDETTRPADESSYAHRVSTTAWATLALLTAIQDPQR